MSSLLNFLAIGVALGALYGLIATSMGLIWQSTKVLDLAVGGYAAVAGMVTAAVGFPWGALAGLAAGVAASLVMGVIFLALQRRGVTDQISAAFASIGLLFASTSFVLWYFGTDPRYVEFITGTWLLGDISFSRQGVFNVAVAFVVVGAVLWGMHRTQAGGELRATNTTETWKSGKHTSELQSREDIGCRVLLHNER